MKEKGKKHFYQLMYLNTLRKLEKNAFEKNKNNNDVIFNKLNKKIKMKLDYKKEYIDKLNFIPIQVIRM